MEDTFVSAKAYGRTVTIAGYSEDSTIGEMLDIFKAISISLTYDEAIWKEAIIQLADEYTQERSHGIMLPSDRPVWNQELRKEYE